MMNQKTTITKPLNQNSMIKRYFDNETYTKLGQPDLGCKMFAIKSGKKIWGTIASIKYMGNKSKHKGKIELGISPFKSE